MTLEAVPEPEPAPRWRSVIRWLVMVAGFCGLVLVTRQAARGEDALPSAPVALAAAILYGVAGLAAARAWTTLLGPAADPWEARGVMYTSQLAKYVPGGGILQAAGQVTLSTTEELPMRATALAWATSIALTVSAGGALTALLVLAPDLPAWTRLASLLGLLLVGLADRRVLAAALRLARKVVHRVPEPDALAPPDALWRAWGWIVANLVLVALSFTLILRDLDPTISLFSAAPAFVAAWMVGFLLVPLPAGLGARELVIVALVPGSTTGIVLAASLSQRVVAAFAEVTVLICHKIARARRDRRGRPAAAGR